MDLLLTILRAAHCRSTHHFFAIDALKLMRTERGRLLSNIALRYHDRYLAGAKDPDTLFRDFHNHVIHVQDGNWAGATKSAELWANRVKEFLAAGNFDEAAHALGVLSHYFSDPFMPLHTAQSDIETVLHRPMEWRICCAYESIYQASLSDDIQVTFDLGRESDWLSRAIERGAVIANRSYQSLLQNYDLDAGVKSPPNGLNDTSRELLSELFAVVLHGWARVVERIAEDTHCNIPSYSLAPATLIAGLKMPVRWITRRVESNEEREQIKALFAEYQLTGTVVRNLPMEIRQVNTIYKAEQANKSRSTDVANPQSITAEISTNEVKPDREKVVLPIVETIPNDRADLLKFPVPKLRLDSPLVDAPSIGRKTAARFERYDIITVADFLAADPHQLSAQLTVGWITAELLIEWQAQSRLQCEVPLIRVLDTQLLVGAGIRSREALRGADAALLARDIKRFAATSVGKRYCRNGKIPDAEKVASWIDAVNNDRTQARVA